MKTVNGIPACTHSNKRDTYLWVNSLGQEWMLCPACLRKADAVKARGKATSPKCEVCGAEAPLAKRGYFIPITDKQGRIFGGGRMAVGVICDRCLTGAMELYAEMHLPLGGVTP